MACVAHKDMEMMRFGWCNFIVSTLIGGGVFYFVWEYVLHPSLKNLDIEQIKMPDIGIEPTTFTLRMCCSTD